MQLHLVVNRQWLLHRASAMDSFTSMPTLRETFQRLLSFWNVSAMSTRTDSEQFYRILMQQERMGEASRFTPTEVQRFANGLKRHQVNTSKISTLAAGAKPNISLKVTEKPKPLGAWGNTHDAGALKDTMVSVAQHPTVNLAKPQPIPVKEDSVEDGPTHVDLDAYLKKYEGMFWADMAEESDDEEDNSAW